MTLIPVRSDSLAKKGQIQMTAVMYACRSKILRSRRVLQAGSQGQSRLASCRAILLSGPAGANKSALARRLLAESAELAAIADFQLVYRALTDIERGRDGRYPLTRQSPVAAHRVCPES